MTAPERVVFDCNIYFQALTSPRGPARRVLEYATTGRVSLFTSTYTLDELQDVAARPHILRKYGLQSSVVEAFLKAFAPARPVLSLSLTSLTFRVIQATLNTSTLLWQSTPN